MVTITNNAKHCMKYLILFLSLTIAAATAHAQSISRVVAGTVKSARGNIAGTTIFEKGTPNGISSDDQGRFRITLRGTSNVLIVQAVGHEAREVNVSNVNTVTVTLNVADD